MLNAIAVRSNLVTTLVIFDSQVSDLPILYNALLPGSIAHTIQPNQDPINHITQLLTQTGATKLAIVAHGQPGVIQIGNGVIDRAMLEARSGLLQEWGVDSIGLYACEVGMNTEFIQRFGELTGAQIAASSGKLGAGNWELDGGMKLLSINQLADYSGKLATFNGTPGNDTAVGGTIIGFIGGSVPELNDPFGDTFTAGAGDDYVRAGNGDDVIDGGTGINYLDAGAGDDRIDSYMRDIIVGNAGNNLLYTHISIPTDAYTIEFTSANNGKFKINGTQTGNFYGIDQLYFSGGSGNDVINAAVAIPSVTPPGIAAGFGTFGLNVSTNAGNDIVLGSGNKDSIEGGSGDDALYGQGGDDTILGDAGFDTIFGGAGIDTLSGGDLNDQIFGGTENDLIKGDEGEDYLYGEDGDDNIKGGYGFDIIYGQAGSDTIYGEGVTVNTFSGDDTTVAPAAGVGINDTIFGGLGVDYIYGGIGDDVLLGEEGVDFIRGGDGNDFIYGGIGDDSLIGNAGNDYLVGQDGNDGLVGEDGSDYISGDAGADGITGGNDNDFLYGNVGDDLIAGNAGNDFLDGGDGGDLLNGGEGSDTIFGVEGNDGIYGQDGEDYLYGGNGYDGLYGGNGNDVLFGGDSVDFLIGGADSDILTGGADSDKFLYEWISDAGDTITDFNPLAGGDNIELFALFNSLGVASSAVNTDYLQFIPVGVGGTNTAVQVDQDGIAGAYGFVTMATLNNVTASQLSFGVGGNVLF